MLRALSHMGICRLVRLCRHYIMVRIGYRRGNLDDVDRTPDPSQSHANTHTRKCTFSFTLYAQTYSYTCTHLSLSLSLSMCVFVSSPTTTTTTTTPTGLQCFEGMKAYKSLSDDTLRLFRPIQNMRRLSRSMKRLSMPGHDFDGKELIECISELVFLDQGWIPEGEGYSLYIRPTVIATHEYLGQAPPTSLLLYVITSPVGPYYQSGFKPIRLTADTSLVRAWPGGTGNAKVRATQTKTETHPQTHRTRELWTCSSSHCVGTHLISVPTDRFFLQLLMLTVLSLVHSYFVAYLGQYPSGRGELCSHYEATGKGRQGWVQPSVVVVRRRRDHYRSRNDEHFLLSH